jgi:uracil-DNA glycosylase family 4
MAQKFFLSEIEADQQSQVDKSHVDLDANCVQCGMYRKSKTPKLKVSGKGKLKTLIIAEASGGSEDEIGKQLVGMVGKFFRQKLVDHDLSLDIDFFKINALGCRPHDSGANRQPTDEEIKMCNPRVLQAIADTKPHFIWLMGGIAVKSLYSGLFKNKKISRWRGLCIPDERFNAWVLPLFHPSYPMREEKDYNLQAVYDADLKNAINFIKLTPPFVSQNYIDRVKVVTDYKNVVELLDMTLGKAKSLAFDYECNCKKPYIRGAKVATVSLCYDTSVAYAFPYQYVGHFTPEEQKTIKAKWRHIMLNKGIHKVAQNMKFENNWTKLIFGVTPRNWSFDTMLAAHILDNREGFTGLKFQTFLNFGILPYDTHIKPYLRSKRGHFNTVMKAPLTDLLQYNGLDSLFTQMIKKIQIKELNRRKKKGARLHKAYKFFHNGTLALAQVEQTGINIDEEYYKKEDARLTKEVKRQEEKIHSSHAVKDFVKHTGRGLNINADADLRILFYDLLGKETYKFTKVSGAASVNAEMLQIMNHPIADRILKRRRLLKIQSNYLGQFFRENIGGRLYPFFDLHLVPTYRGNAYEPSFHNIPSVTRMPNVQHGLVSSRLMGGR